MINLKIDEEFKNLIPALSAEEFTKLENSIITEGCRDDIVTWHGVIVDGHNRYNICTKNNIEFNVVEKDFGSRDDVIDWMYENQLARRNLTDKQRAYIRGLQYEREKKKDLFKGNQYTSGGVQNAHNQTTSKRLAEQHKIDESTIRRDGDYAKSIDQIAVNIGTDIKDKILMDEILITKKDINKLVKYQPAEQIDIINKISDKQIKNIKDYELQQKKQEILQQTRNSVKDNRPKVWLMDCVKWLDLQPQCDLLITDPPFSTDVDNIEDFVDMWLYKALNKVKSTGFAYVFIGNYPIEIKAYLNAKIPDYIKLEQMLTWSYKNTLGNTSNKKYINSCQKILFFRGVNAGDLNIDKDNNEQWIVQEFNSPDGRLGNRYHTWQKPIELAERLIRHTTKPGDIVLDPFTCTGTFVLAAGRLGRQGFGCDINLQNLEIAVSRGCDLQ